MNSIVCDRVSNALSFQAIAEDEVFIVVSGANLPNFARNIALSELDGYCYGTFMTFEDWKLTSERTQS